MQKIVSLVRAIKDLWPIKIPKNRKDKWFIRFYSPKIGKYQEIYISQTKLSFFMIAIK